MDEIKDYLRERREEASVTNVCVGRYTCIHLLGELWPSVDGGEFAGGSITLGRKGSCNRRTHTRTNAHTRVRMHLCGALPMIYVYR